ncbi:MAG: PaaI family thioesterase [Elsteraceae bacterium]|jgi:uncharacterized protein (TIGR00369 family)
MNDAAPMDIAAFEALIAEELPITAMLGITVVEIQPGFARLRLAGDERCSRPGPAITGPALFALADVAMYAAILGAIGPVRMAVTTGLNINFLRMAPLAPVIGEARVMKLGKKLVYLDVAIRPEAGGDVIAHATGTYARP